MGTRKSSKRKYSQAISLPREAYFLLAPTVLAPLLYGSSNLWSKAILFIFAGVLILFSSLRLKLSPISFIFLSLFIIFSGSAWLPFSLFSETPWWQILLEEKLGFEWGIFRTPQPWLSLEAYILLLGSIFWFIFLASHHWTHTQQYLLLGFFSIGISLVGFVCLSTWTIGFPELSGGGTDATVIGPFPNRNQSANVFAIGSIILIGLMRHDLHHYSKRLFLWGTLLAILVTSLFVIQSKGGLLTFFFGIIVIFIPRKLSQTQIPQLAIVCSVVAISIIATVLWSNRLVEFSQRIFLQDSIESMGFRMIIAKDCLNMIYEMPLFGTGIGQFSYLFPLWREATLIDHSRIIHPDNGWLWLTVELGTTSTLIIVFLLTYIFFTRKTKSFEQSPWLTRSIEASLIAFLFHNLLDISGCRIGSAWPAIFLLALLYNTKRPKNEIPAPIILKKCTGVIMITFGMLWLLSYIGIHIIPNSNTTALKRLEGITALQRNIPSEALRAFSEARRFTPLDANLLSLEAIALAQSNPSNPSIVKRFEAARLLEPASLTTPYIEGEVWKKLYPQRALEAWWNMLLRSRKINKAPFTYSQILIDAGTNTINRRILGSWAINDPSLLISWLKTTTTEEFKDTMNLFLSKDPKLKTLSKEALTELFEIWFIKDEHDTLISYTNKNPEIISCAWLPLARIYWKRKEFQKALMLSNEHLTSPKLPLVTKETNMRKLMEDHLQNPKNLYKGLHLLIIQYQAHKYYEAAATAKRLESLPQKPAYYFYICKNVYQQLEKYDLAWEMLHKYLKQSKDTKS